MLREEAQCRPGHPRDVMKEGETSVAKLNGMVMFDICRGTRQEG